MARFFSTTPDELSALAKRIETSPEPDARPVENSAGSAAGHAGVASAIEACCTRWATGRDLARHEVAMASATMRQSAELYRAGDAAAGQTFWNFSL